MGGTLIKLCPFNNCTLYLFSHTGGLNISCHQVIAYESRGIYAFNVGVTLYFQMS
jgi:hypothetical protein